MHDVIPNRLCFLLAGGALEVAIEDHGKRRVRRSETGRNAGVNLIQVGLERTVINVEHFTVQDALAVARNVENLVLRARQISHVDIDFFQAGNGGRLGIVDSDLNSRVH